MSKYLTTILTFLFLAGCISISHKEVYMAHTPEFEEKEKQYAISLDSATLICADYRFKKEKTDTIDTYLYLIYEDHYIFADQHRFYNAKTGLYYLPGVWVNAKTGKAKYVKGEKYVQLPIVDPIYFSLGYYRKQFIRSEFNRTETKR